MSMTDAFNQVSSGLSSYDNNTKQFQPGSTEALSDFLSKGDETCGSNGLFYGGQFICRARFKSSVGQDLMNEPYFGDMIYANMDEFKAANQIDDRNPNGVEAMLIAQNNDWIIAPNGAFYEPTDALKNDISNNRLDIYHPTGCLYSHRSAVFAWEDIQYQSMNTAEREHYIDEVGSSSIVKDVAYKYDMIDSENIVSSVGDSKDVIDSRRQTHCKDMWNNRFNHYDESMNDKVPSFYEQLHPNQAANIRQTAFTAVQGTIAGTAATVRDMKQRILEADGIISDSSIADKQYE